MHVFREELGSEQDFPALKITAHEEAPIELDQGLYPRIDHEVIPDSYLGEDCPYIGKEYVEEG